MTGVRTAPLERRILDYLSRHEYVTRDTIANALGCSRVACATNLNKLAARGLVERCDNDEFEHGGPRYPYRWKLVETK